MATLKPSKTKDRRTRLEHVTTAGRKMMAMAL